MREGFEEFLSEYVVLVRIHTSKLDVYTLPLYLQARIGVRIRGGLTQFQKTAYNYVATAFLGLSAGVISEERELDDEWVCPQGCNAV